MKEYSACDVTCTVGEEELIRIYTRDHYITLGAAGIALTKCVPGDPAREITPMEPVVMSSHDLYQAIFSYATSKGRTLH
jgi:hypothetical protein